MEAATISALELLPAKSGEVLATEWEAYRAHVGAWLAEGREGQYVLVKESKVLGFFDTETDAMREGYKRFHMEPFLVHHVLSREPLHRVGYYRLCQV